MYKEVTDAIINVVSRFKGVNCVRYQGNDLNNQQQNHKTLQCYIDDVTLHSFNVTENIARVEYEIYILGFPTSESGNTILDVQDKCYDAALYTIAYLDNDPSLRNVVSVRDYSILTLSRYSEQSNAGVKLSLVLNIPNGVNMCELEDWFNDEPYEEDEDHNITGVTPSEITEELTINPIHLPRTNNC